MEVEKILTERKSVHGDWDCNATTAEQLQEITCRLDVEPAIRQAIFMICAKLARIRCGNPHQLDHWKDIQGYAELAIRHIQEKKA